MSLIALLTMAIERVRCALGGRTKHLVSSPLCMVKQWNEYYQLRKKKLVGQRWLLLQYGGTRINLDGGEEPRTDRFCRSPIL